MPSPSPVVSHSNVNVFPIEGSAAQRPFHLTVMAGSDAVILLDTGCAADVPGIVAKIEALPVEIYMSRHWPVMHGAEAVASCCRESRSFVERAEVALLHQLENEQNPRTLRQLCESLGPQLGDWPTEVNLERGYAFAGHLTDLEARGLIREDREITPFTYRISPA